MVVQENPDQQQLEVFLAAHEHLIFHTPAFHQFISKAFGVPVFCLAALDDQKEIKAILPVVDISSLLLGKKVISMGYLEYGGFAGDPAYVPEILEHLTAKYGSSYSFLEIRGGITSFSEQLEKLLVKQPLYKRFILPLRSSEEVWQGIQKSKRKAIKKALKDVEVKDIPAEELNSFYGLYCRNMKEFGSPPYSRDYFKIFYDKIVFPGLGKIVGAYHQGRLVAALLGFCYQDKVHILIAVSDPRFQEFRSNDAVHWHLIDWACRQGYRVFDFGRVREHSGQYEYKAKWGGTVQELPSYFLLWQKKEVPLVDPTQHQFLVNVWRKLPLGVTKVLGPRLRKGLGI